MADLLVYRSQKDALPEKYKDLGDGSMAKVVALAATPTISIGEVSLLSSVGTYDEHALAAGGTAENMFGGVVPTNGFEIYNPNYATEPVYFREAGAATVGTNFSTAVQPGQTYTSPPGYKPTGAISLNAATTGHKVTGRAW